MSARGLGGATPERRREIASVGGKAAHAKGTAHEWTAEEARVVGRRGGEAISQDREHMAAIGRKGGEVVSRDRERMAEIGRKGGRAISAQHEHMARIGRRGGQVTAERAGNADAGARDALPSVCPPTPSERCSL